MQAKRSATKTASESTEEVIPKEVPVRIRRDPASTFLMQVGDGRGFKHLIEFCTETTEPASFYFFKDKMLISASSPRKSLEMIVTIDAKNMLRYHLNLAKVNNPEAGCHIISPHLKTLTLANKSVKKDDIVCLRQDCSGTMVHQKLPSGHEGAISVLDVKASPPSCKDKLKRPAPNVTILLSAFIQTVSEISKSKNNKGAIIVTKRGLIVVAENPNGEISNRSVWSPDTIDHKINDEATSISSFYTHPNVVESVVVISNKILKILSKTSSFSSAGIVRVYSCQTPSIVRLEIPVSSFGVAYIYLESEVDDVPM